MNPFAPFFIAAQLLALQAPEAKIFHPQQPGVKQQKHHRMPLETHKGHVKPYR